MARVNSYGDSLFEEDKMFDKMVKLLKEFCSYDMKIDEDQHWVEGKAFGLVVYGEVEPKSYQLEVSKNYNPIVQRWQGYSYTELSHDVEDLKFFGEFQNG